MTSDPQRPEVPVLPLGHVPQGAPPRSLPRWAPTAAFVALVATIGALVGFAGDGSGEQAGDRPELDVAEAEESATDVGFGGPRDGLDSRRLPVTVTPSGALIDGQTVTVSGTEFPPGRALGVVMCSPHGPSAEGGVANCQISPYTAVTSDAQGNFTVEHVVRRWITLGNGVHDCAAAPPEGAAASCVVAVGAIDDYDQSGIAAVAFDPDGPGTPPLAVTGPPAHPVAEGDPVTVRIENAPPGSSWWIDVCGYRPNDEVDEWGHTTYVTACAESTTSQVVCDDHGCPILPPAGLELVADAAGRASHTFPAPATITSPDGVVVGCRAPSECTVTVRAGDDSYWTGYPLQVLDAAPPSAPPQTTIPPAPTETTIADTAPTETTIADTTPTTAADTTATSVEVTSPPDATTSTTDTTVSRPTP